MFFDAHNHLHDNRLADHLDEIVATCNDQSITRMVVNGTRPDDWPRVLELAQRYSFIIPSFGLHPWFTNDAPADWKAQLLEHLDAAPSVIGEIGLDRWMENSDLEKQESVLRAQLEIATERNLPVSVHCLKCWGKLDEVLRSSRLPKRGFLLHSYGGPAEMIDGFVELGAYFSISGYFAHERKAKQRDVFRHVPIERLLVETDAPDMLPPKEMSSFELDDANVEPLNHPANLPAIYRFAAEVRGMEMDAFVEQIRENFERLFG